MSTVLMLQDDPLLETLLGSATGRLGDVLRACLPQQLCQWIDGGVCRPRLVVMDMDAPACRNHRHDAVQALTRLCALTPRPHILLMCSEHDEQTLETALQAALPHVLCRPFGEHEMVAAVQDLRAECPELWLPCSAVPETPGEPQDVGVLIRQYADLPFPVLISGESGTGKEGVARALHEASRRKSQPFICVNCAAINDSLIEAALFGHARGAFTGAQGSRAGYFEEAGSGTLFLDEIGEMPMHLQAKLLRVLENGDFIPVGESRPRQACARVIAATNRDLDAEGGAGFRRDLYFRLSVLPIHIAPLRDRRADKLALWDHFMRLLARQLEREACALAHDARALWLDYPFPGNVRELRNIIIRLLVSHPGQVLSAAELSPHLRFAGNQRRAGPGASLLMPFPHEFLEQPDFQLQTFLRQWERQFIEVALERCEGNVSAAARMLGIHRTTLYHRFDSLALRE